jgi:hypothetical protein
MQAKVIEMAHVTPVLHLRTTGVMKALICRGLLRNRTDGILSKYPAR